MKRSPIQLDQLNPIGDREAESFFRAAQCDKMLIIAYREGGATIHCWQRNVCPHDLLAMARELLDAAMEGLIEENHE